jgi:hypothetical protein
MVMITIRRVPELAAERALSTPVRAKECDAAISAEPACSTVVSRSRTLPL